jgi:hypothetical protein
MQILWNAIREFFKAFDAFGYPKGKYYMRGPGPKCRAKNIQ